jgi:carboxypeptidase family protein
MKRLVIIVIVAVMAGCGNPVAPARPPSPSTPSLPAAFKVTGLIIDASGGVVADAHVELVESSGARRSTTSDDRGFYRFDGIVGNVILSASKPDYYMQIAVKFVSGDAVFDLTLERVKHLIISEVFRGIVNGPPYDPIGWDAKAPSCRILFVAPETGTVDVLLAWAGNSELDLLVPGVGYWDSKSPPIRASWTVRAGAAYELIINSYYAVVPFELRADLRVGG